MDFAKREFERQHGAHEVGSNDDDGSSGSEYTHHLTQREFGVGEVLDALETGDDIEAGIGEGQREGVSFNEAKSRNGWGLEAARIEINARGVIAGVG